MWALATWAHREGERDRHMVWFDPASVFATRCTSQGAEAWNNSFYEHVAIWKIRIRPVPDADLNTKRVGILSEDRGGNIDRTELAQFFTVREDGTEEWQISKTWESIGGDTAPQGGCRFLVWYQDGHGRTYYDDNEGQLYRASW